MGGVCAAYKGVRGGGGGRFGQSEAVERVLAGKAGRAVQLSS